MSPTLDVYGPFDSTGSKAIAGLAGDLSSEIVPLDVVEQLLAVVLHSDQPGLAAWLVARTVSVACGADFSGSASSLPDEYVVEHLSPVIEPRGGLAALYGSLHGLSSSAGEERDRANPARVPGLTLWVEGSDTSAVKVTIDRRCGRRFDACVSDSGLGVALIQPNRHLSELTIDDLPTDGDLSPQFYGVHPVDRSAQSQAVDRALALADGTQLASIAMVAELATVEEDAADLSNLSFENLKIVVSGSYHHLDENGTRRNSILTHFVGEPSLIRRHSKTGVFKVKVTREVREGFGFDGEQHEWMDGRQLSEKVEPSFEVRVFLGEKISCVVLICADFLDRSVKAVLDKLRPTVVLVSSMTPKVGVFVNQAQGLVGSSQSTTILINNPGDFCATGALCVLPVAQRERQVVEGPVGSASGVAVVNTRHRSMRVLTEAPIDEVTRGVTSRVAP
ncbi:MAG: hypothetical protein WBQ44_11535 [Rhodococcus sp. (in: high G+C Gram-positive bacteria)]